MRWITLKKASELSGLATSFYDERTGRSGHWPEGVVWKWFEGRKMIDVDAMDSFIDNDTSAPSKRGRKKATPCQA
ncbi:hypothetical protein KW830_08390 [Comamonas sp. CMM03]|uniref:hypothetical protein n=1 Tax=Comamonas sp. CMM03 TaxID=2854781 RepID=UPI001C459A05|nr:hypothetical protein [Comamonas sp. CMM03]MBV7418474.1 hypothetical protein [Comamonas sp. CMM03]